MPIVHLVHSSFAVFNSLRQQVATTRHNAPLFARLRGQPAKKGNVSSQGNETSYHGLLGDVAPRRGASE
jgi:hypothetical protein